MTLWRAVFLPAAIGAAFGTIAGAVVVVAVLHPSVAGLVQAAERRDTATFSRLIDPPSGTALVQAVYAQANPGVVSIVTTLEPAPSQFFSSARPEQGAGSGFVVDDQGDIVTNQHVVDGANQLRVTFSDGSSVPARVLGQDPGDDLAVVKVDVSSDRLHALTLADSRLVQVGEPAIAIGNPFNLHNTVTSGIVSGLGRTRTSVNGRSIPDMIQTDAPANPGNSGGPLLDAGGSVIGVLAQIESPVRGSVGVGFAIPSNTVARQLSKLIAGQTIAYPWLGVSGQALTDDVVKQLNLSVNQGVYVVGVVPGGPADTAGVKAAAPNANRSGPGLGGDVITALDGVPIHTVQDIGTFLAAKNVGDSVSLTVQRNNDTLTLAATLAAWPDQPPTG